MKEYFPERKAVRVVEPRRIITSSIDRRMNSKRRILIALLCILIAAALASASYCVKRAYLLRQRALQEQLSTSQQESAAAFRTEQAHVKIQQSLRAKLAASEQIAEKRSAELRAKQDQIRAFATRTVKHYSKLADELVADPAMVREVLISSKQVADQHGLPSGDISRRLERLPTRHSVAANSHVFVSDVVEDNSTIRATLTIEDSKGHFLHGVTRGDVEVVNIGRRLHAISFHQTRRAVSHHEIALLLDTSGSTNGAPHEAVKMAAIQLVRHLANPNRMRVWKFADTVEPLSPWSIDAELHEQAINQLTSGGGTALYQAVQTASDSLNTRQGERAIVLFTDGKNSGAPASIESTLEHCRQRAIPIHVVMLETQETDERLLQSVAKVTGGTFYRASNPSQLTNQFAEVALSFQQPCYQLLIHEPVEPGSLTIQVTDLKPVSLLPPK